MRSKQELLEELNNTISAKAKFKSIEISMYVSSEDAKISIDYLKEYYLKTELGCTKFQYEVEWMTKEDCLLTFKFGV